LSAKVTALTDPLKAGDFIERHPGYHGEILTYYAYLDSGENAQLFLSKNIGAQWESGAFIYKILQKSECTLFRAKYIFFDGANLTTRELDGRRKQAWDQLKSGKNFSQVFKAYNMDGNDSEGDLGWTPEGKTHRDFEQAVKQHAIDELFMLDIPDLNWYYIAMRTHENIRTPNVMVLKLDAKK
jgi:hypothetical protein